MPHHTEPKGNTRVSLETEGVRGQCGHEPLLWFPWEGMGKQG